MDQNYVAEVDFTNAEWEEWTEWVDEIVEALEWEKSHPEDWVFPEQW